MTSAHRALLRLVDLQTHGPNPLSDIDLSLDKGEIVALLDKGDRRNGDAASLQRLIAGLNPPGHDRVKGEIILDDRPIHRLAPHQRRIAASLGDDNLYPSLSVGDNLALILKKTNPDADAAQIDIIAELLLIDDLLDRRPRELSADETRRANLAAAFIPPAKLYLLAWDSLQNNPRNPSQNNDLLDRTRRLIKRKNAAALIKTGHDDDAFILADRLAVLADGRLRQCDDPETVYRQPADIEVAKRIGRPQINLFSGRLESDSERIALIFDDGPRFDFPTSRFIAAPNADDPDADNHERRLLFGIRPHALKRRDENGLPARLLAVAQLGDRNHPVIRLQNMNAVMIECERHDCAIGQTIPLTLQSDGLHIFDADDGQALMHGRPDDDRDADDDDRDADDGETADHADHGDEASDAEDDRDADDGETADHADNGDHADHADHASDAEDDRDGDDDDRDGDDDETADHADDDPADAANDDDPDRENPENAQRNANPS